MYWGWPFSPYILASTAVLLTNRFSVRRQFRRGIKSIVTVNAGVTLFVRKYIVLFPLSCLSKLEGLQIQRTCNSFVPVSFRTRFRSSRSGISVVVADLKILDTSPDVIVE